MMKKLIYILPLFLLTACVGTYSDNFMYINDSKAVLDWKDSDFRLAGKGSRRARADSHLYEEFYKYTGAEEQFQLYIGMFTKGYIWKTTRTAATFKEMIAYLPLVQHANELTYHDFIQETKFMKAHLTIDDQQCIAFIDFLQKNTRDQGHNYRTQLLGGYCVAEGKELTAAVESEMLSSYELVAEAYDGRGMFVDEE